MNRVLREKAFEEILQFVKYEKSSGRCTWNKDGRGFGIGKHIGTVDCKGYLVFKFNGKTYKYHHLIWFIHNGVSPVGIYDHIDGNTLNNKISNIRIVSPSHSSYNTKLYSNNKSGCKGVHYSEIHKKWVSRINVFGNKKHLGYFVNKQDAILARKEAEINYGVSKLLRQSACKLEGIEEIDV